MMSIMGARTKIRIPMKSVIWVAATSLVNRVMREAVVKCSMLAKENFCTQSYSFARRLAPKPMAARLARAAEPTPQKREATAMTTILRPVSII